jgi:hypothetical protein
MTEVLLLDEPRMEEAARPAAADVVVWHESAPAAIRGAEFGRQRPAAWRAWQARLRRRRWPRALQALYAAQDSAPSLGVHASGNGHATMHGHSALDLVQRARRLVELAQSEAPEAWWRNVAELVVAAGAGDDAPPLPESQYRQIELPLTLAALLPEIVACRPLATAANAALAEALLQHLDGSGIPRTPAAAASHVALLACWARCRLLSHLIRPVRADDGRLQGLLRHALRLLKADGRLALPARGTDTDSRPLLRAAVAAIGGRSERRLARGLLDRRPRRPTGTAELPDTGARSEAGRWAVLRRGWRASGELFSVSWSASEWSCELCVGSDDLLAGDCSPRVEVEGRPLAQAGDWEEVCWVSDENVDYLEMEARWEDGLLIQRQVLLARDDRFMLLADAVLGDRSRLLDYRCTWPLASGAHQRPADETCEVSVCAGRTRACVVPLALGEWRVASGAGELQATARGLELRQAQRGRGLWAPLWIDLDPRRQRAQPTWRRLTVGELLHKVTPDVAAGYRVQIGDRQWLVYRSLTSVVPRSLLGLHTASDFLVARFSPAGTCDLLLDIE